MVRFIAAVLFFTVVLFPLAEARPTEDGIIGTVVEVEGTAQVIPAGAASGTAAEAETTTVHMGDSVVTGPQSRAFILFIDNTQLTLSENARVTIDDYVFNPDNNKENKAAYSVTGGAFQYISGLIGHKEDPDVHIDTPVGSIGIRGTNFWGGNFEGKYNVAVIDGKVALKTDAGEELVQRGQGTSVGDRHSRPLRAKLLESARFGRMAETVKLRRRALVDQRIHQMQSRNWALQRNYKNYMKAHRRDGRWLKDPGTTGNGAENREEKMQERREKKRERLEEKRERREGLMQPDSGQGLQPKQERLQQHAQQGRQGNAKLEEWRKHRRERFQRRQQQDEGQ